MPPASAPAVPDPASDPPADEPAGGSGRLRLLLRIARWDLAAKLAFGIHAPVKFQRLYVDPRDVALRLNFAGTGKRAARGGGRITRRDAIATLKQRTPTILGGDWDTLTEPLGTSNSVNALVRRRIAEGLGWDEVGEVRRMRRALAARGALGPETGALLEARYRGLDALIGHVRAGGEILPPAALGRARFRELGGIEVAIDRHGRFLRLGDGNHRLAIAQHFGLPRIPVCLIVVHESCVASGTFRDILAASRRLRRMAPAADASTHPCP